MIVNSDAVRVDFTHTVASGFADVQDLSGAWVEVE